MPLFHSVRFPQADIKGITLYTTIDLYDHGQYVKKLLLTRRYLFSKRNPRLKFARILTKNGRNFLFIPTFFKGHTADSLNYIVLTIDRAALFTNLDAVTEEPYDLTIQSETGQTLYRIDYLTKQQRTQKQWLVGSAVIEEAPVLLDNHWQIVLLKPHSHFQQSTVSSWCGTHYLWFCISDIGFIQLVASKTVVQPINSLAQQMASLSMDQFKIEHSYSSEDEVGQLYTNFQKC